MSGTGVLAADWVGTFDRYAGKREQCEEGRQQKDEEHGVDGCMIVCGVKPDEPKPKPKPRSRAALTSMLTLCRTQRSVSWGCGPCAVRGVSLCVVAYRDSVHSRQ